MQTNAMRWMTSGTAALHVEVRGQSPDRDTLVLINSMGTDFRIWSEALPALESRYNLVLHDKRGHGLSDLGEAPISIQTYADDIAALLRAWRVERPIIVGLSVGGLVAFELYRQLGTRVKALVFSNTAAKIGNDRIWSDRIAAVEAGGMTAIADMVMQRWFTPDFRHAGSGLYALCRNMFLRNNPQAYMACCAAIRDADCRDVARSVAVPSLFIGGDQDGTTPAAIVEEASRLVPGSRLEIISSAAHLPCIEKPKVFSDLVTNFISSL